MSEPVSTAGWDILDVFDALEISRRHLDWCDLCRRLNRRRPYPSHPSAQRLKRSILPHQRMVLRVERVRKFTTGAPTYVPDDSHEVRWFVDAITSLCFRYSARRVRESWRTGGFHFRLVE